MGVFTASKADELERDNRSSFLSSRCWAIGLLPNMKSQETEGSACEKSSSHSDTVFARLSTTPDLSSEDMFENKRDNATRTISCTFESAISSPYLMVLRSLQNFKTLKICAFLAAALLVLMTAALVCDLWTGTTPHNAIYVPGAGFSGFWFTLGRLQSIPNPQDMDYYCFSAGCLGVAATLLTNHTVGNVVDMAFKVQQGYKDGSIGRFSVVESFVDSLVPIGTRRIIVDSPSSQDNSTQSPQCPISNNTSYGAQHRPVSNQYHDEVLSRIHVITSSMDSWFRWKTTIRTPRNISELREMLIQTTWIPFATGNGLGHQDSDTGKLHMDGGVTALFHPRCQHFLGLPAVRMPSLLLNFLNVNLGAAEAVAFWEAGRSMGV